MHRSVMQRNQDRRGVILIVVLAMLFLFAALGVTFSLISRLESQSGASFKVKLKPTSVGASAAGSSVDADPLPIFQNTIMQIIHDTSDTHSSLRGHSLLRDMYGGGGTGDANPRANNAAAADYPSGATGPYESPSFRNWWRNAYNGLGIRAPKRIADNGSGPTLAAYQTEVIAAFRNPYGIPTGPGSYPFHFMEFGNIGGYASRTPFAAFDFTKRQPEHYFTGATDFFVGFNEDYDYPDWNNMFLAMELPDGRIIQPSYHRPYLVRELEVAGAFTSGTTPGIAWTDANDGWRVILRPRALEYDASAANGGAPATWKWKNLTDNDGSGVFGKDSSECDVDSDGDHLKDAIWLDTGEPVKPIPGGGPTDFYKPLVAIKLVALDGRISLNTAGNILGSSGKGHSSNLGYSPAEINPKHGLLYENWTAVVDYSYLFYGVASGVKGKYTSAAAAAGATSETAGDTGVDDQYTKFVGPTDTQTAISRLFNGAQIAATSVFPPSLDYPAGLLESGFFTNPLIGYNNQLEIKSIYDATADVGTNAYGLRDLPGRGRFVLPGQTVPGGFAGVNPPPNKRDIMGYFPNYERDLYTNNWQDNSNEINPYRERDDFPGSSEDSPLGSANIEGMLRFNDIDSTSQNSGGIRLLPDELSSNISTTAEIAKNYGKHRMRHLFSHVNWDLNTFNAPPEFRVTGSALGDTVPPGADDMGDKSELATAPYFNKRHQGSFDGAVPADGLTTSAATPPSIPASAPPIAAGSYIVNPRQNLPAAGFQVFHPWATIAAVNPAGPPYAGNFNLYPTELLEGRRFNLNRPLRKYRETDRTLALPLPANVGPEVDRQIMAAQIYMILRAATHTRDPGTWDPNATTADGVLSKRIAQLAQLAVNIVDYIDTDDVVTRFWFDPMLNDNTWNPGAFTNNVVLGFELPRLVVNEGVGFFYRDFIIGTDTQSTLWTFAELSNPFPTRSASGAFPPPAPGAPDEDELQVGLTDENTVPAVGPQPQQSRWLRGNYTLEIQAKPNPTGVPTKIQGHGTEFDNSSARVNAARGRRIRGKNSTLIGTNDDDQSFYVVGPNPDNATEFPANETFLDGFQFTPTPATDIDYGRSLGATPDTSLALVRLGPGATIPGAVTFRLKRLRNPYERKAENTLLPTDPDQNFNPMVVVDEFTIDAGAIWDITRTIDTDPTTAATLVANRISQERRQPWRGDKALSTGVTDPGTGMPLAGKHTLSVMTTPKRIRKNSIEDATAGSMYVHMLNRPLTTPQELLNVRLFSTGQSRDIPVGTSANYSAPVSRFITDMTNGDLQMVPWIRDIGLIPTSSPATPPSPSTFPDNLPGDLFRFFEFTETPSKFRGAGDDWRSNDLLPTVFGTFRYPDHHATRVAGKMNPNLMFSEEAFRAWIDSDEANPMTSPQLENIGYPVHDASTMAGQLNAPVFHDQFKIRAFDGPGVTGITGLAAGTPNRGGSHPADTVNSKMYAEFLLSLAGRDGVLGTSDDKPFRSYGAASINDTIMRVRDYRLLDVKDDGTATMTDAEMLRQARLFDGLDVAPTTVTDPYANPYAVPPTTATMNPDTAADDTVEAVTVDPVTRNLQAYDRNRLLAKIGSNTTTRSNVFAVWVTVGFFRVTAGTETGTPPMIEDELGLATGTNVRHRAFFIVDRSLATGYRGPQTSPSTYTFTNDPLVRLYRVIE